MTMEKCIKCEVCCLIHILLHHWLNRTINGLLKTNLKGASNEFGIDVPDRLTKITVATLHD